MTRCAIWYNLYNLQNVKNAHVEMSLLVKLHAGCFPPLLNCTDDTKSHKASQVFRKLSMTSFADLVFSTFRFFINILLYVPDFNVRNLPVTLNYYHACVEKSF